MGDELTQASQSFSGEVEDVLLLSIDPPSVIVAAAAPSLSTTSWLESGSIPTTRLNKTSGGAAPPEAVAELPFVVADLSAAVAARR